MVVSTLDLHHCWTSKLTCDIGCIRNCSFQRGSSDSLVGGMDVLCRRNYSHCKLLLIHRSQGNWSRIRGAARSLPHWGGSIRRRGRENAGVSKANGTRALEYLPTHAHLRITI